MREHILGPEDDLPIDDLLDGHAPTEDWLATDAAMRILSDAERRMDLYRAMHPRPDLRHGPLLRALLAREVVFRRDTPDDVGDRFENLYWCALLLSQLGDVHDVIALWRAKNADFDTSCGFDVQFLVGGGVRQTLAFLTQLNDPDATKAAEYVSKCAAAGDFNNLEGWLAGRRAYFK